MALRTSWVKQHWLPLGVVRLSGVSPLVGANGAITVSVARRIAATATWLRCVQRVPVSDHLTPVLGLICHCGSSGSALLAASAPPGRLLGCLLRRSLGSRHFYRRLLSGYEAAQLTRLRRMGRVTGLREFGHSRSPIIGLGLLGRASLA